YFPGGDIGSLINVAGVAVLKSSKKVQLAEKFVKFALSKAGQRFFVEGNNEYPVVKGVPLEGARGLKDVRALQAPGVDLGELTDLRGTIRLLQEAGMLPK
ncbi:MAG: iron ABC transporter substrate-binding protein, partial [Nitrospinota bacterium]